MKSYEELLAERDALAAQVADAFGDGYYEGFVDGAKHQDSVDLNTKSQNGLAQIQDDALRCSEIAEGEKSKRLGIVTRQELVAQVESLKSAVRAVQAVPKRSGFAVNDPNPKAEFVAWARLNEVMSASPAQCLREIQAEAGLAGYLEGHLDGLGDPDEIDKEHAAYRANQYAAKIRNNGTWLKDSNVNGGKRHGGE